MTQTAQMRNHLAAAGDGLSGTTAPLTNVSLCLAAMQRAMERPAHLPGMVCMSGPSGWGKTSAAVYVANEYRGYYVELQSSWTRKKVLLAILQTMGIEPAQTIYDLADQVCEQLVRSGRPLIVDELDHLVNKQAVEIIRDLHQGSDGSPILIIGEENIPNKLRRWERFHRRVLEWVQVQPADLADCQHLVNLYCQDVVIERDLVEAIHKHSRGSAGRITVNVELVRDEATKSGFASIGLADWGSRPFYTGEVTVRRMR